MNPEMSELDIEMSRINVLQEEIEDIMDIKSGNLGKGGLENVLVLFVSLETTMVKRA